MMEQVVRRQGESKKEYYRRMAWIRKARYGYASRQQVIYAQKIQDCCINEEFIESKTKNSNRPESKSQQKIRNRMAAQQSRERHRSYVTQLERKIKMYEEIIDKQNLFCKNCKKNLIVEFQSSEEFTQKSRNSNDLMSKQLIVQSYLNQQIIRIDHAGSFTPFGIFFIVFAIAAIALISIDSGGSQPTDSRVLLGDTNFKSIHATNIPPRSKAQILPSFAEFVKGIGSNAPQFCKSEKSEFKNIIQDLDDPSKEVRGWKKVGNYICSQPQVVVNKCSAELMPQFLLLRTQRNRTQSKMEREEYNLKIVHSEWQKVEISQCFRGQY